jgi:LmbE family N-acetylglucosaminyl deacetylase
MRKLLFGVFAHPDDEAFGPSGTLLKRVRDGEELHLICITKGQAGMNPDAHSDLGEVRFKEWQAAGEKLGASSMHCLDYQDGTLNNQYFHEIAEKIEKTIRDACDKHQDQVELNFITLDSNGLTGHLDHVAASHITSYLFYGLKDSPPENVKLGTIDYFCFTSRQVPKPDTSFVFMPAGHEESYISKTLDVSDVLDEKIAIMREHHTQRGDAEDMLKQSEKLLSQEHFHTAT